MKHDWTITFNDGSSATYFNTNLLDAVKTALADWAPVKHPVSWSKYQVDIFNLSLN